MKPLKYLLQEYIFYKFPSIHVYAVTVETCIWTDGHTFDYQEQFYFSLSRLDDLLNHLIKLFNTAQYNFQYFKKKLTESFGDNKCDTKF